MNQEKIGNFISQRRKQKGLTQEQLGEKLNVSKNAVSKWERGICMMDIALLEPLSNILDVSIAELLNGEKALNTDTAASSTQEPAQTITLVLKFSREKLTEYKRKVLLSALFLISLLPMLTNQYGGMRGVQEISGIINLANPIGLLSTGFFFIGTWINFKRKSLNLLIGSVGTTGIILSEIFQFLTWYVPNHQYKPSIVHSLQNVFPTFYIGTVFSVLMTITYILLNKKWYAKVRP